MKNFVLEKIENAQIEKALDVGSVKDLDWIWINEEIFRDLLLNLEFEEEKIEKILKEARKEEILKGISKMFHKNGYVEMDQYVFADLEKDYKPTRDIETIIFVKEKYQRKLLIRQMNRYRWMLRAMAIDTFKMERDKSLKEIYKDLYEENTRIVEDILSSGEYIYLVGRWKFVKESEELYFYKSGEFYHSWAERQADARFEEIIK